MPAEDLRKGVWSNSPSFCAGSECHSERRSHFFDDDMLAGNNWTVWKISESPFGTPVLTVVNVSAQREPLSNFRYTFPEPIFDDDDTDDEDGSSREYYDYIRNFADNQRVAASVWSTDGFYVTLNAATFERTVSVGLVSHPASPIPAITGMHKSPVIQVFENGFLCSPNFDTGDIDFVSLDDHLYPLESRERFEVVLEDCTTPVPSTKKHDRRNKYRARWMYKNNTSTGYWNRRTDIDLHYGDTDTTVTSEEENSMPWEWN